MRIITNITTKLEKVKHSVRDEINAAPTDADTHRSYMKLPCMNAIERGGEGTLDTLPRDFRVVAWNLERCLKVKASAQLLARPNPDIILLSEMDNGMSRTAQKHTTKRLAKRLNMYYLYGVEFLELDLGSDADKAYAKDKDNERGFHGNALLSKMPLEKAAMLRFDDHGHWFSGQQVGDSFGQRRVGGRMALLALVNTEDNGQVCFVSTHFESNSGVEGRDKQLFDLITAVEAFAGSDTPVIIGGDLNTGNNLPKHQDHTVESLFETAESYGYHWRANKDGTTTRPSLLTQRPDRVMKLDWFCARQIESHFQQIIPALDEKGTPLSDHDPILADWSLDNELTSVKPANKPSEH